MSGPLLRFFVAPERDAPEPRRPARPARAVAMAAPAAVDFTPPQPPVIAARPPSVRVPSTSGGGVVVLAGASDIEVAAGGAAALSRRFGGLPVACVWSPDAGPASGVATGLPTAVRLARRLQAHELDARAVGSLVRVTLAREPAEAVAQLRRARAVTGAPVAVVLARRARALDVVIEEAAAVVTVAGEDIAMSELVTAQVTALNPRAVTVARPLSLGVRLLHRVGLQAFAPATGGGAEVPA